MFKPIEIYYEQHKKAGPMSKYYPPTPDPTPEEIAERESEIQAGWDERRWEKERRKQGVRSVEVRNPMDAINEFLGSG